MKRYLKELVLLLAVFGGLPFDVMTDTAYAQTGPLRLNGVKFGTRDSSAYVPVYGAKCDGTTDDSTAIQSAITAVNAAGGGTVYFPANSNCRIASALNVLGNVTLQGINSNGYNYTDQSGSYPVGKAGSWIYVDVGAGSTSSATPALKLNDNSTVTNLNFYYPNQLDGAATVGAVVLYPPTIGMATTIRNSPVIRNVNFNNSYIAIDLGSAQRPLVQNVGIGALFRGVMIDGCGDIARFENIHVWPFFQPNGVSNVVKTYSENNLIAFYIGHVDGLEASKLFVYGALKGFYGFSGSGGTMWGRIENFELDSVQLPIDIEAGNTFQEEFLHGVIIAGNEVSPAYGSYAIRYAGTAASNHWATFSDLRILEYSGTHVRDTFQLAGGWGVQISNVQMWSGGTDDSVGNPASHIHVTGTVTDLQIDNVTARDAGTGSKVISLWANAATTMTVTNYTSWFVNTDLQEDSASADVSITGSKLLSGITSVNQTAGTLFLNPGNEITGAVTTTSAPQTWDARDGTVKAATYTRTTSGAIQIGDATGTQINLYPGGSTNGWQVLSSGAIIPIGNDTENIGSGTAKIHVLTLTNINTPGGGQSLALNGVLQGGLPAKANNTIASATTIAPTALITHITGTTTIQTMTAPANFAVTNGGGCLLLVFDGIAPWNAAGNIFVAGTPTTAGTNVQFCYDNATLKWYPSRVL